MSEIQSTLHQKLLTITLTRPDKLNALNESMLKKLSALFADAKDNSDIHAILITGENKAFCAGADIQKLAECNSESGYVFAKLGQSVFRQLETLGKPSLAAINGYAFGGGCELAMAATMRIASSNAQFGQPEAKLGVIPGYGGTQRLARLVGKGRALDLCLTCRFIDAQTALNWGLITEVTDPDNLLPRAKEILHTILQASPIAISSVMETIDHGYDLSLEDALHLEAIHFARTCASTDKKEGVSAFLEKRKPTFIGA